MEISLELFFFFFLGHPLVVHGDLCVEGSIPEWLWLFLPSHDGDFRHSFLNPLMRAVLGSRETTGIGGERPLSVFLPLSLGFPGRYADSANKEWAGLRQVSLYSEPLSSETAASFKDPPFLAIFLSRVVQ